VKRTPVPIVVLVVLVLVSELGLRAIAGHLQPPIVWANREVQHKVAAMDALRGSGGASVVFVGSSMTNAAASPQLATRLLKTARPAFNASDRKSVV